MLLWLIDGIDDAKEDIILVATNKKDNLDAAIMSRFDVIIWFPLPYLDTRVASCTESNWRTRMCTQWRISLGTSPAESSQMCARRWIA